MNPESRLFIDGELVPAASGRTYANIHLPLRAVPREVTRHGLRP